MIYLEHLLEATQGIVYTPGKLSHFPAFNHDSRQLIPGELFVAVRGERSNGHDYVLDAVLRGAAGLLVEAHFMPALVQELRSEEQVTIIVVEDTRLALQQYARFILARWRPTVIAVTGSAGKTSTKEAIATVLSQNFATFRSWQNYNDLLGLPLSLGRLEERHEYAVIELGCDHPGEIADLCAIAQPQIGVLTNISPTQLQDFGTTEQLAHELSQIFTYLSGARIAIYNQDDELTCSTLSRDTRQQDGVVYLPFAPSQLQQVTSDWKGTRSVLPLPQSSDNEKSLLLSSGLVGPHYTTTMLAAYTVARYCGMSNEEIQHALKDVQPQPGRLQVLEGRQGARLLDDTHNAIPASMVAGLTTLKLLPGRRRIAVLGDMLALGTYEEEAHRLVGWQAAQCVDFLITRGERAALIAEAARNAGLSNERITVTSTHEDAAQAVLEILQRDDPTDGQEADSVLLKGSEEMRMERVTERLLAHPESAVERLVRQTPGWKQIIMTRPERPTWIEVDLNAIANNTRRIKNLVGANVQVLISLKADAYGHGALKVARTALHNGATMLGVATVSEAVPLREAGIEAPILVFGYVPLWQMREAVRQGVTVTLYASESAHALSRAALTLEKIVKVHLKIDTGMSRLGIRAEQSAEIVALARELTTLPGLEFEGLYTHFAEADSADRTSIQRQLARFHTIIRLLEREGLRPPVVHAANSAATISEPASHFDMVRPGIAIYGLDPSTDIRLPEGFRAALSFKTQVAQVKLIPAGEKISYGGTYTTEQPTLIAVLPVGYADGFRRGPQNWGSVLLHGQEAPLLGRVCMDQCMVDVSNIPQVRMGDEVVLIGRQGNASLSAERVAERLGTINYEVVSEILARVPRVD